MLLTEPFDVAVVIAAQVAEATGPIRTSLPSMFGRPRPAGPSVAALGLASAQIAHRGPDDQEREHHAVDHHARASCS